MVCLINRYQVGLLVSASLPVSCALPLFFTMARHGVHDAGSPHSANGESFEVFCDRYSVGHYIPLEGSAGGTWARRMQHMERPEYWVSTGRMTRAEWMKIYEAEEAVEEAQGIAVFRTLRSAETLWVPNRPGDDDGDDQDRPPAPPPGEPSVGSNRSTSGKKTTGKNRNKSTKETVTQQSMQRMASPHNASQHCNAPQTTQCESPQVAASSFPGPDYKVAEEADGHISPLLPTDPPSSISSIHEHDDAQRRSPPSPLSHYSPRRLAEPMMVSSSDDEESRMTNPKQFSLTNVNAMMPHFIVEQVTEFPQVPMHAMIFNAPAGIAQNRRRLTLHWSTNPNTLQQPVEAGQGFQII